MKTSAAIFALAALAGNVVAQAANTTTVTVANMTATSTTTFTSCTATVYPTYCPVVNPVTVYPSCAPCPTSTVTVTAGAAGAAGAVGAAGTTTTVTVGQATTVYIYPTAVSTYVPTNTVINIFNNYITINNAPTTLITTVLATSTQVSTTTATTTATTTTTGALTNYPTPFVLALIGNAAKVKRQSSGSYAQGAGTTNTCSSGSQFVLTNGQLVFVGGSAVSVAPGLNYAPFLTSSGSVSSGFSISSTSGFLQWSNSAFASAVVTFGLSGGVLEAVFNIAYAPSGFTSAQLLVVPVASCPSNGTTTSGNSTTSTPPTNGTSSTTAPYPVNNSTTTTPTGSSGTGVVTGTHMRRAYFY